MQCRHCSADIPANARFCPQCGAFLVVDSTPTPTPASRRTGWGLFWATLLGSLALSYVFTAIFHWPIFLFGAIVPLLWGIRPPHR